MMTYERLVKARKFGVPFPETDAYQKLLTSIRMDASFSTIGRRAVLWLIETSGLSFPVMAAFSHRDWGPSIGLELQQTADDISGKYHDDFIACGTGLHLTHHCGGFDDHGRWRSEFPGNTLWIAEGDDHYPRPSGGRDNEHMVIITPRLAEIGAINL